MNKSLQVHTNPKMKERIRSELIEPSNNFLWKIKFNMALQESSISSQTTHITDKSGKKLKCDIRYNKADNLIIIRPLEAYTDNTLYFLHISNGVKGSTGRSLSDEVTVRFLLSNKVVKEIEVLKGNVTNIEKKQNTLTEKHNMKDLMEHKKFLGYRWPIYFFLICWLMIVICYILFIDLDTWTMPVLIIGSIIGWSCVLIPICFQIRKRAIEINKSILTFNRGVDFFNTGDYQQALICFNSISNNNVHARVAIKKIYKYLSD